MAKNSSPLIRRTRDFAAYGLFRVLAAAVGILPERAAVLCGRAFGWLFWHLSAKRRLRALKHIEDALAGELGKEEVRRLARESFTHIGLTVIETLWAAKRVGKDDAFFDGRFPMEGLEAVKAELAKGHGALGATLHVGNWELFGARVGAGLVMPPPTALPGKNRRVSDRVNRIREQMGVRLISSEGGVRPMLAALKDGCLLGFLIDRHVDTAYAHTTFFGRDAATSTIVAALARRLDIPVFIGYSVRDGFSFRHRGFAEGPIELVKTDDRESDVRVNTQRFNDHFEAAVRKHPEQWLWVQKRWKLEKTLRREQRQEAAEEAPPAT
jgi:KDO2-lipid IV(A) lauroyltransferase